MTGATVRAILLASPRPEVRELGGPDRMILKRWGYAVFAWWSITPAGKASYLGRTIHEVRVWASGEGGAP